MRTRLALACFAVSLATAAATAHALEQPNGAPVPSAMGCDGGSPTGLAAVLACECATPGACNIGGPCPSESSCPDGRTDTCETTLWHTFNDNTCIPSNLAGLDPAAEAAVEPQTFQPTCPLTFTVVSRGTAIFGDVFGWYNATGARPDANQLYVMLDCHAAEGTQVVLDVQSDPRYLGGEIGFFIATPEASGACAGGNCCASIDRVNAGTGYVYYSERTYNPDAAGADAYIHLVVFDSHITERKFYFAWEDIFGGSNNDFTDLVTSVEGVECSGGGKSCDTGVPGVCAYGVSACSYSSGGALECRDLYTPSAEQCDALDNDCDAVIDEGATCPTTDGVDDVCHNGRCIPNCEVVHEFDCPADTVCHAETGRCFDPTCVDVQCPADKVCRDGNCVTPCDGIVCPAGQVCRFGDCLDLCAGVACSAGEVCREGVCFPGCGSCAGVQCAAGLTCAADSGDCFDDSCPGGCPASTFCEDGECLDACDGAVCPNGLACVDGTCGGGGGGGGDDDSDGDGDAGGGDAGARDDAGGCGCAKGAPAMPAEAMLVFFLLLPGRRKRR